MDRREFLKCSLMLGVWGTAAGLFPAFAGTKSTGKIETESDMMKKAIETVFSTSMEDYAARQDAMKVIEAANWHCTPDVFKQYYTAGLTLSPAEVRSWGRREPIFRFYEAAWDKICKEVKSARPSGDTVILWLVYNMGYIIKTAQTCFAIDLQHRRSEELIEKLDFLLVTHNHDDHYTSRLLKSFRDTKRPVVSNFFPAPGYNAVDKTLEIGPARIHLRRTDHNPTLKKFVMTYEIELSLRSGKFVIFHSGDSCDPKQFRMHNPRTDVYMVHPRVGLNVTEAQKIIDPELTLISHLHEMHHRFDQWRWPYAVGFDEIEKGRACGRHCAMPLWGEKIVLKPSGLR